MYPWYVTRSMIDHAQSATHDCQPFDFDAVRQQQVRLVTSAKHLIMFPPSTVCSSRRMLPLCAGIFAVLMDCPHWSFKDSDIEIPDCTLITNQPPD